MKNFFMKKLLVLSLLAITIYSCSRVTLSGRRRLALIPESTMQSLALTQYKGFLGTNPPVKNTAEAQMLAKVGARLSKAVNEYMASKNLTKQLAGYHWEFNLVNNKDINAWCMPGGKVVVYTGLLPITANEAGLAAVIGHEVSHALARHGSERMTQSMIAQGIALTGDIATSNNTNVNNTFNQAFGLGGTLGLLAFSRKHESEADEMGMIFMALAGYDPKEAIEVWKRMAAKGGAKPPEMLSTHPSDATRIANLTKSLSKAMVFYRPQ
jgi:predicted Zn-dependent protease